MDFANQKARKVGVFTDSTIAKLLPMKMAIESLEENGVQYEIYDKTRVEPNEQSCVFRFPFFVFFSPRRANDAYSGLGTHSWRDAITFSKQHDFSHFLAVGGGSVIGSFPFPPSSFRSSSFFSLRLTSPFRFPPLESDALAAPQIPPKSPTSSPSTKTPTSTISSTRPSVKVSLSRRL